MIQRIQTVFLLLAGISIGLLFLNSISFASTTSEDSVANSSFSDGFFSLQDHVILIVLVGIGLLLFLGGVALFKNRPLQMKVTRLGIVATILVFILAVILFIIDYQKLADGTKIEVEFGIILPILAIVFGILGLRYINKDEKIVRSADRLR